MLPDIFHGKLSHIDEQIMRQVGNCLQLPGIEFQACDFFALTGPIIYVVSSATRVLYVGMSRNGLMRPAQPSHQTLSDIKHEAKSVKIYPCKSEQDARRGETLLIAALAPIYNRTKRKNILAELLGTT